MSEITSVLGREVLDSRGNPTVEVELSTADNKARAIVPSGASTGIYEALELRDGGDRYSGKGVKKAVDNIAAIAEKVRGMDPVDQEKIDSVMLDLDNTPNKSRLGANAILGVSMAAARLAALEKDTPLFKRLAWVSKAKEPSIPVPFANIINGGRHAGNKLAMQEFMIAPVYADTFSQATQAVAETYHILKGIIKDKYGKNAINVGDEGGFAPDIDNAYQALDLIMEAVNKSGYSDILRIAMDPAASEFYDKETESYMIEKKLSKDEMVDYYLDLMEKYPICSIEDPFDQDDFYSYEKLTKNAKIQIVGDDLLVTNVERIKVAAEKKLCTALLLKVNQIGSLTESIAAAKLAFENGWKVMVSHRSGETEDSFIADLAAGLGCGQIKLGATCRSDRTAKYNQLLRIEEESGLPYAKW
jgi:enolase